MIDSAVAELEARHSLSEAEVAELRAEARRIRLRVLEMFVQSGRGHFGGCFSVTEILVALYAKVLRVRPVEPDWPDRDRMILSKGHANAALCAVLAEHGYFDPAELDTYGRFASKIGMHVDMHVIPGCDMSAGSLGHGLPVGLGMALAGGADMRPYRVYVVLGDGECDEGSVWEAALVAGHHRTENLTAIVDRNKISQTGFTEEIARLEPFADKWRAFGWHVIEVDGHDFRQVYAGIAEAREIRDQPTAIIAATIKGKGVSFMEGNPAYHSGGISGELLATARAELQVGV